MNQCLFSVLNLDAGPMQSQRILFRAQAPSSHDSPTFKQCMKSSLMVGAYRLTV